MEAAAAAVAAQQVVSTGVEVGVAYGIAKPTKAHTATYTRFSSEAFLPRVHHSLTAVNGKAYIFGGETEKGELAGDEVHIVTLPVKGREDDQPDYKCVPSLGEGVDGRTPGKRAGHTAVAVEGKIYLFGGRAEDRKPSEEFGRVWVFDTSTLGWSFIDPTDSLGAPPARFSHAAVGTTKPEPGSEWTMMEEIQNMVTKTTAPIDPEVKAYGTVIVHGGQSSETATLSDTWAFDISSRSWSSLPSLPSERPPSSTLALSNEVLYTITSTSDFAHDIHSLPLKAVAKRLMPNQGSWSTTTIPTNPLTPGPVARKGAPLIPITTGSGRLYLLYLMGERVHPASSSTEKPSAESDPTAPTLLSDTYLYGLPSPLTTASGLKDSIRSTVGLTTPSQSWEEAGIAADVESTDEGAGGKAHPGPRAYMAWDSLNYAVNAVMEGGHGVVIWGGKNARGEVEGDGWVVRVG